MASRCGYPSSTQASVKQDFRSPTYYKRLKGKQIWFPNCGCIQPAVEITAQLCLCQVRIELNYFWNQQKLQDWLSKDCKTERELAYWIPKYVLM